MIKTRITDRLFSFFFESFLFLFCFILLPEPSPLHVDLTRLRYDHLVSHQCNAHTLKSQLLGKSFVKWKWDVSQGIPLVASRLRGSDTKLKSVKGRAGGSIDRTGGSTGCGRQYRLLEQGAEKASGKSSIRRILAEIGTRKHQRKVGKSLKHKIRGSKPQIAHQIERSNEIHMGYFF